MQSEVAAMEETVETYRYNGRARRIEGALLRYVFMLLFPSTGGEWKSVPNKDSR